MTRAVGYIRQSRQSEAGASPEAQRRAIESYVESQGWTMVETFADIGRSGFDPKAQRPGLDDLFGVIERGGVDRVVVWKVDRLTRRGIGEALALVERIEAAGAALVSVTEPFDTSSALGQGIFALLLSLARAESEKLAERVRSGKAIVRERGGWLGGPVPFGFVSERISRPGHTASQLVVDPERAPIVRTMVQHVLDGGSVRSLVGKLAADGVAPPRGREWSHASLLGLLRNPALAGYLPDGRGDVLRDDSGAAILHGESIVTATEWLALQRRVVERKGRKPAVPSLLGGIALCESCQTTMGADTSRNQYQCSRAARGLHCDAPARVPMRATNDFVLGVFAYRLEIEVAAHDPSEGFERGRLLDLVARWWALRDGALDVGALTAEVDEIDAARARLREMYVAGDFADDPAQYRALYARYEQRHTALRGQLDGLEHLPTPAEVGEPGFVESLDFQTRRELIAEALIIECVKAGRPGIRFVPDDRIILTLA